MKPVLRSFSACLLPALLLVVPSSFAQSAAPAAAAAPQTISLPTFTRTFTAAGKDSSYTVIGEDPAKGGTTTIQTVLVPITLTFEAPMDGAGKKAVLDAGPIVPRFSTRPSLRSMRFLPGRRNIPML